jgi:hypothetical protein
MGDNFDRWLEDELGKRLDSIDPGYVAPRYLASGRRGSHRGRVGFLAGLPLPALLTTKVAAASMVVLAATGTGVAVKTVTTGTANPLVWGQQVKTQVDKCKDALPAGQHGIGECVSTFATQHGSSTSSSASSHSDSSRDSSSSTTTGNGNGNGGDNNGKAKGKPTAQPTPQGQSDTHPTPQGQSSSHPTPPPHPTPHLGSPSTGGNAAATGATTP